MTNRQRVFIEEYLRCWNAAEAARRAGYSVKTARQMGKENLTKPDIAQAISERISEKAMSADETLIRLAEHARGDMGDFLAIGTMGFEVDLDNAREKGLLHLIKKVRMRTVTTLQKDGVETESHDMEVELYDAQAALVHIGRHHGLFKDKTELTGADGSPLELEIKPVDYRLAIAALAPGSMDDSEAPSESKNTFDGAEMG